MLYAGTAIWIFCILVNRASTGTTILTNVSFELDGDAATTKPYEHIPDPSRGPYLYNITAFERTGLSIGEHTLVMTAIQGAKPSLLLFDYAVYTWVVRHTRSRSCELTNIL